MYKPIEINNGVQSEVSYFNRLEVMKKYAHANKLKTTPGVSLCANSNITVVIPAFNEAKRIAATIVSVYKSDPQAEIVIVDNNSEDGTDKIVSHLRDQRQISNPLFLLTEMKKGEGYARKRGEDEVIAQYLERGIIRPHYIVSTDADTKVPRDWVEAIRAVSQDRTVNAFGGKCKVPEWVDKRIEEATHTPNDPDIHEFFNSVEDVLIFMIQNGLAFPHTSGSNSAIEVASYAFVGGIKQLFNRKGEITKGIDWKLGIDITRNGGVVGFLPAVVEVSPRRSLYFMIERIAPQELVNLQDNVNQNTSWVDLRYDERFLLEIACQAFSRSDWENQKRKTEILQIKQYVILPILLRVQNIQPLIDFFGGSDPFIIALQNAMKSAVIMQDSEELQTIAETISNKYTEDIIRKVNERKDKISYKETQQ